MRVAVNWLFERLGIDAALSGDLEECRRGRSAWWYWMQVAVAVWLAIWRGIRDHKLLAVRAVAVGCAVNTGWLVVFWRFPLPGVPSISARGWILGFTVTMLTQVVSGWIVARTHRAAPLPMVLVFATWLLLWFVGSDLPEQKRLLVNSIDQPRFRLYVVWYYSIIFSEMIGLLLGGLLCARPKLQLTSATDSHQD